ncbi:MAG: hypothetical protein WD623_05200 [Marinobacter sp.]|uniref:hypothetical protein n=1 Tax=Marinobacter sp. TaxID=50741 RepID=UPI0034A07571
MTVMFRCYRFQGWETTELVELLLSPYAREVLSCWLTDLQFLDENLEPALLPFTDEAGGGLLNLVERVVNGHSSARILEELLDSGLVEQAAVGIFLLRRAAYVPSPSEQPEEIPREDIPHQRGNTGNRAGYRTRHTDREFCTSSERS